MAAPDPEFVAEAARSAASLFDYGILSGVLGLAVLVIWGLIRRVDTLYTALNAEKDARRNDVVAYAKEGELNRVAMGEMVGIAKSTQEMIKDSIRDGGGGKR